MARPRHPEYKQVSVRLPLDVLDKVLTLAAQERRSMSDQLVYAIERWLATEERKRRELVGSATP